MSTHKWVRAVSAALALVVLATLLIASLAPPRAGAAGPGPSFAFSFGGLGSAEGELAFPSGIAIDSEDDVYVADRGNHRIQKFDSSGAFLTEWGSEGIGAGEFASPSGVAVDSRDNVYVSDFGNDRVQKFDSSGDFIRQWGRTGDGDGEFTHPTGIGVGGDNNVYVADFGAARVQKFDFSGSFLRKWETTHDVDDVFVLRRVSASDSRGSIYLSDFTQDRIQKFDSSWSYLLDWGSTGDGSGEFAHPTGIAIDSRDRVYIADGGNSRIQVFTQAEPAGGGATLPPASCGPISGPYDASNRPGACWRPYAATSPFNRQVPADPKLLSNSGAIVDRLVGWGETQDLTAGHSGSESDWWHPIYYSKPTDPTYTVRCTRWTSSCDIDGDRLQIPAKAKAAAGGDGHMSVIDQSSGIEYDFWQVHSKPSGGGVIEVSHGGKTQIAGDGLGSNATAAHFGLAAGIIRGDEILAGEINHALFSQIKCTSGSAVYPAAAGTSAAACSNFGLTNKDAPPLGARLWLAMSDAQIQALAVPAWKKTILGAMADYGILVGDSMNGNSSWGIQAESGASYTSFGQKDPWDTVGERANAPAYNGGYVFDIAGGVDWARYLRVLDPCVSQGSC